MELKEIIDAFAAGLDVDGVIPDDGGTYRFVIDGMVVSFVGAGDTLFTWAEVGEVPPAERERLYRVLLESTFQGEQTKGGAFAIDPESDKIYLQRFDAIPALTPENFKAMLESFVNILERWREIVADVRLLAPDQERREKAEAEESRGLSLGGFMRV